MNQIFKKSILFGGFVAFSLCSHAQQDAQYTQYMFNPLSVNSAYAGSKDALDIVLISRNQWVGIEGAPKTQSLTINAPIKKEKLGLGFSYVRDNIGPLTVNTFYLDFAYRVKVHEGGFLSMGVKAGIDAKKVALTDLSPVDPSDPSYYSDLISKLSPNFGTGLFYYGEKHYLGISTPKISRSDLSVDGSNGLTGIEETARHYFIIGGYVFDISPTLKYKPAFYTKLVKGAPASFDFTSSFMIKDKFVGGVAYRFGDSFGVMTEVNLVSNLWFGYAYDFTVSPLKGYNKGTHEIMLTFDFSTKRTDIIKSPRFF